MLKERAMTSHGGKWGEEEHARKFWRRCSTGRVLLSGQRCTGPAWTTVAAAWEKRPSVAAWDVLNRSENCVRNAGTPQPVLLPRCAPSVAPSQSSSAYPRHSEVLRRFDTWLRCSTLLRSSATPTLLSIHTPAAAIYQFIYQQMSVRFSASSDHMFLIPMSKIKKSSLILKRRRRKIVNKN